MPARTASGPLVNHPPHLSVERTVNGIARDAKHDIDLARAAASGDAAAFETLVRANADAVFGHCLRFFCDRTAAEDATQEVFLKVYRRIGSYDGRSALSTWLYRLTENTCLDLARVAKRTPTPADPATMPDPAGDDPTDARDDAALMRAAIAALPDDERDALSAIGLFEMTYAEAAEVLGVPAGTVKSRVFRARQAMVAALYAEDPDRGGGEYPQPDHDNYRRNR
jgi:RNA polymerase sigma-70 factor (ECF subfamily)